MNKKTIKIIFDLILIFLWTFITFYINKVYFSDGIFTYFIIAFILYIIILLGIKKIIDKLIDKRGKNEKRK